MATMRGLVEPRAVLSAAPARRARADAAPSRHVLARALSQSDADAGGVEGAAERALRVKEMQRRLLEQVQEQKRLLAQAAGSDMVDSSGAGPSGRAAASRSTRKATGRAEEAPSPAAPTRPRKPAVPTPAPARSPVRAASAVDAAAAAAASASRAAPTLPATPAAADATGAEEPPVADAPPPPCKERLNVVMVAMECAPWSKTGGLGDVAGALPKALAKRGHRTMCVSPRYSNYIEGWETGVRIHLEVCGNQVEVGFFHGFIDGVDYVFVDHPCFHSHKHALYGGDREALLFRCALLCQAALELPWVLPCGGVPYGEENLVFLANDWHTALLPAFLQGFYRDHGKLTYARCALVLHNLAHQGRGPLSDFNRLGLPEGWRDAFRLDDPVGGTGMNILKAGLLTAHRLIAVSEGYAWECSTEMGGWGLAGVVRSQGAKLCGVVNGIDLEEWNPATDPHLTSDGYINYTPDEAGLKLKAQCKAALQRELGLPEDPDKPLIGFIGRLDYQKGVDLICNAADHLVGQGAQLVLLGSGTAELEGQLRGVESRHRTSARGWVGFSVAMAHRITAGADILLMPSRFEPCGLNQLYAMRYGTVPVVHAVGGLRDTVKPFQPFENTGTGWTFSPADQGRMNEALGNAMHTYRTYRESFQGIQLRGMAQDLSWDSAAAKYEDAMLGAKYTW